jgi:diacylglycerol O-acyltransferase
MELIARARQALGGRSAWPRLNPLDTAFLDVEEADRHSSLVIGSVAILEGPAPSQAEIVTELAPRLRTVPRSRQVVRGAPLV